MEAMLKMSRLDIEALRAAAASWSAVWDLASKSREAPADHLRRPARPLLDDLVGGAGRELAVDRLRGLSALDQAADEDLFGRADLRLLVRVLFGSLGVFRAHPIKATPRSRPSRT